MARRRQRFAPVIKDYKKFFEVITQKRVSPVSDEVYTVTSIRFKNQKLIDALRDITNDPAFYQPMPVKSPSEIFCFINTINESPDKECQELSNYLNSHFEETRKTLENMKKEGTISFDLLWSLFKKGDEVIFVDNGGLKTGGSIQGGKVTSCEYQEGFFSRSFKVNVQQVGSDGRNFRMCEETFSIASFDDVKKTELLPVMPITPEIKEMLTKRGRFYSEIANKVNYLDYNGHLIWKEWFGVQMYQAIGRCMVDQVSFYRQNPRYTYKSSEEQSLEFIPETMLFACKPRVCGFSFATKRWGELSLDSLMPVNFNNNAFDTLVLEKDTKKMVRSLVEHAGKSFQDIIHGKGGGCIFLLHGQPGTGKTLTAESIAEVLHRPLYSVSVGELGTSPEHLEKSLREILEMATIWNAVVLIDEADIFLESRHDDSDIDRNAMVGIFLRLLEYHQGVMFLTTNRVQTFDRAFHSRISIAIKYPDLTEKERFQVWTNLVGAAKLDEQRPKNVLPLDLKRLSKHNVNGRQIKTAIRLAQALAKAEGTHVTTELMERPIIHSESFLKEVETKRVPRLVGEVSTTRKKTKLRRRREQKRKIAAEEV